MNSGIYGFGQDGVQLQSAEAGSNTNDHGITRHFTTLLAANLHLRDSVLQLGTIIQEYASGVEEGNDASNDARGATNRNSYFLWHLMSKLLSGDPPSGLIPSPTLPDIDFTRYRRNGESIVRAIVEDDVLTAVFREGSLSPASLEASKAPLDWSLSTPGPSPRSPVVIELCKRGSGKVGDALGMEKVASGGGLHRRIFKGLGLKLFEVADAVEVMCAWECGNKGNGDRAAVERNGSVVELLGNTGSDAGVVSGEFDNRVRMIREAHACTEMQTHDKSFLDSQRQLKRIKTPGFVTGISSSSDWQDDALWEHVFCALSTPWAYALEQAVSLCGSLIDWSVLSDASIASLLQIDFALVDEAAFHAFDERVREIPDHVVPVVEECGALCRSIIHRDIGSNMKLNWLAELDPLLKATASQTEPCHDPIFDAARKAILAYRALSPGKSQLVMISKKHWQALYRVLEDAKLTVLELSIPQHAAYFGIGTNCGGGTRAGHGAAEGDRHAKTGSQSISDSEAIWKDFDCFLLSTDEELVWKGNTSSIAGAFKRIVLLETDPTLVRLLDPLLRSAYDLGVSVCIMRVGLGLVKTGAFRLEAPERAEHEAGAQDVYESFKDGHGSVLVAESGLYHQKTLPRAFIDQPISLPPFERMERKNDQHMGINEGNVRHHQAKASLGDPIVTRRGRSAVPGLGPAEGEPLVTATGTGMDAFPRVGMPLDHQQSQKQRDEDVFGAQRQTHMISQLADNLFSDREDSFLHDSFFDRNSARGGSVPEQLVQTAWQPFENGGFQEFDASPYLWHSAQYGPSAVPAPERVGVYAPVQPRAHPRPLQMPTPGTESEHIGSPMYRENMRPAAIGPSLHLDQMVSVGPCPISSRGRLSVFQDQIGEHDLYDPKLAPARDLGERSPFSPLDVMYADHATGGSRTPNGNGYHPSHHVLSPRPNTAWAASQSHLHADIQQFQCQPPSQLYDSRQQSPYLVSTPRTVSPVHLATPPPRFWPQPMDPVASLSRIERMYDEMRAGRPKRRPQRRGEKFKKCQ